MSVNNKFFSLYWASSAVLLFFLGLIFSGSLQQTPFRNLGFYTIALSIILLVSFFIYSLGYIIFTGDKSLKKMFITIYLSLSVLSIVEGLVCMLLKLSFGFPLFFIGIGSLILFWVGVLFYFLFKKEG